MIVLFLISFLSCAVGALSGIGGGVIIKPVLDALTGLGSPAINFISAACVFTMAAVSAVRHLYKKTTFESVAVYLGIGAILGGLAGTEIFNAVLQYLQKDAFMKLLQNILLFLLLCLILAYMNGRNKRKLIIRKRYCVILVGILLGASSSFLGIGGGPINVAALCFAFSMDIKQATANSMILILFSQASKITTILLSGPLPEDMHPSILFYMLPAAVIGGFLGTSLNKRCTKNVLKYSYNCVMLFVMAICLWNVGRAVMQQ